MITHVVVRCEVCQETATIAAAVGAAGAAGWKFENGKPFGMHLCPKHRRLTWEQAREQVWRESITPALELPTFPAESPEG